MAIAQNPLTSGFGDTDGTVFTTASITPTGNRLILIAVMSADNATPPIPDSVVGNGITYTRITGVLYDDTGASRRRMDLYRGMTASPSTGTIVITYPSAIDASMWVISEFSGVDTSGTNGSGAIAQNAVNNNTGTSIIVTLAAEAGTSATYGTFGHNTPQDTTAGTNFTEIHDLQNAVAPQQRLQSEWFNGQDTTVDASWVGSDNNGAVAVEIKAAAVAGTAQIITLIQEDS